jgi:hypothetical protein
VSGRVYIDGGEVVLCLGTTDGEGNEWATAMSPDAAEEMARALILCAHAARGFGVTEAHKAVVQQFTLRRSR